MTKYKVESMSCGGCFRGVERAIKAVDAHAQVTADLAQRQIEVESAQPREAIEQALARAGFPAVEVAAAP